MRGHNKEVYINEVTLKMVDYDESWPTNEGFLLVKVSKTGDEILCGDAECGNHIDMLKKGHKFEAFFSVFGVITSGGHAPDRSRGVEKTGNTGAVRLFGEIVSVKGEWMICDCGFYVYVMSAISSGKHLKAGDKVSIDGNIRIEIILK